MGAAGSGLTAAAIAATFRHSRSAEARQARNRGEAYRNRRNDPQRWGSFPFLTARHDLAASCCQVAAIKPRRSTDGHSRTFLDGTPDGTLNGSMQPRMIGNILKILAHPARFRTHDLCLRRAALYPAELRVRDGPAPNRPRQSVGYRCRNEDARKFGHDELTLEFIAPSRFGGFAVSRGPLCSFAKFSFGQRKSLIVGCSRRRASSAMKLTIPQPDQRHH